ncbi:hypothetical protein BLA60_39305 [Actinophytocola xinjiangensis]|uniref:Uncharacterized protein n=1 Tax=Actinophytocola xinjiangensis TaxID=485602 RepID=A0A7Z0WDD9_9PSEU|nr:hypothetical protein [Actinophytocola xinjiangensis]OLF04782.1 hypothetical protein BLA60_39305 [Actinophytocola xinjiangensis]
MTTPDVSPELRQSLERHRFSLRPRLGEDKVDVVCEENAETFHAGWAEHHLGLWSAFAVVRNTGLLRVDEVGRRHESFEDAVLDVLMSFTHLE